MNKWRVAVLVVAVLLLCGAQAKADSTIVLTFEGIGNVASIGNYYNVGAGMGAAAILRMPLQATR